MYCLVVLPFFFSVRRMQKIWSVDLLRQEQTKRNSKMSKNIMLIRMPYGSAEFSNIVCSKISRYSVGIFYFFSVMKNEMYRFFRGGSILVMQDI
jgi:hypothetical protein